MNSTCIFCQIVEHQRPAELLFEDDRALAFADINPQAPEHVLVIPRRHISTLADAGPEDEGLLGHLLLVGAQIARERGLTARGFRTVINTNADAGQSVYHIHVHILGGRVLRWPPG